MNTLLTDQKITYKALYILENSCKGAGEINHGYDDQFAKTGGKIGASLNIRQPQRYVGRTGQAVNLEGLNDTFVPLTITTQFGVDFECSSSELALSIDDFADRYLKPAMATIANKIDSDVMTAMGQNTANFVGVVGTPPNSALTFLQAGQKLDDMAAADDGLRRMVITPATRVTIVNALTNLFQAAASIASQYKTGMMGGMGETLGFDAWYQDQNVYTHTVGTFASSSPTMTSTANQTGSSIATTGWTAGDILNVGDKFTIGTIFTTGSQAVNPQSRQGTGALQQFTVTSTATADGSGNMTINISPAITPTGQYQNVDQSPAALAAINVWTGTTAPSAKVGRLNMAFHRDAFTLAQVEMPLPDGVDQKYQKRSKKTGAIIRYIRQYVASTDQWISRFDVLYGIAPLYAQTACVIAS